jgi:hypothetical protein
LSAILGIQLGLQAVTGQIPPVDKAMAILEASASNKITKPVDFPLELVDTLAMQVSAERAAMALRILETLLHHAGISTDLTQVQLDGLVTKAWSTVASMESERSTAALLSSVSSH